MNHPVVHVSLQDAHAYATWAHKRLLAEKEWEYAAKGKTDKRYPWGNSWDPRVTNCAEYWIGEKVDDVNKWKMWWADEYQKSRGCPKTTAVGALSNQSEFQVYDLSGNVYEICGDRYRKYDPRRKYTEAYELVFDQYQVLRGGSWMNFRYQVRCGERISVVPDYTSFAIGFRCAKDL